MIFRNISDDTVLTALQCAEIGDNRPPVVNGENRALSHHGVFAMRNGVENFAVSHSTNPIVLERNNGGEAVLFGNAVTSAGGTMTHGAGNIETLLTAFHQCRRNFDREAGAPDESRHREFEGNPHD